MARRKLNLALQGGGAHGAFTWGVLDCLLEDGRFALDGVSGTSAGAMNAVCMVDGFHSAQEEGAREKLSQFWAEIGRHGRFSPIQRTPLDLWLGNWSVANSPAFAFADALSNFYSPYDFSLFDINPLRDVVDDTIDFDNVHACKGLKVFIAATNVWTGKVRLFENREINCDAVMASSCLPQLFKAVEIDGVPHWDGGYMGNPVLFPFFSGTGTDDILLVQINPIERRETPRTARQIADRVNEITFNASLLREFRAIDFVRRLLAQGLLDESRYKSVRMHRIAAPPELVDLTASSKLNAEPRFLEHLKGLGRKSALAWLETESDKVGVEPGIALAEEISHVQP